MRRVADGQYPNEDFYDILDKAAPKLEEIIETWREILSIDNFYGQLKGALEPHFGNDAAKFALFIKEGLKFLVVYN